MCATAGGCAGAPAAAPLPMPVSAEADSALRVPCEATIRRAATSGRRVYREAEVVKPAELVFENRGPRHPEPGGGATIKVEFVIDSVGRADMATFRPLRPAPTDYLRSVWEFVQSSKFTPARIGTRAVAQCGLQSFDFRSDYNDRSR